MMTFITVPKLFPVVLQNDCITDHIPVQIRQFQLQSRMEDLLEPDGLCSLTSSAESKNTGLASPRPALGERRATGPPISFPCPSQACQRGAKPKTSNLQWLLDRLVLEQCGNYGWQEGRCAVERKGGCQPESSHAKSFKSATNERKRKQTNRSLKSSGTFFPPLTFSWHWQHNQLSLGFFILTDHLQWHNIKPIGSLRLWGYKGEWRIMVNTNRFPVLYLISMELVPFLEYISAVSYLLFEGPQLLPAIYTSLYNWFNSVKPPVLHWSDILLLPLHIA